MVRKQASKGEGTDEKKVGVPAPSPSEGSHVSYGAIELRAYDIFLSRGDGPGDAMSDWLQAERELLSGDDPGMTEQR